MYEIDTQVIELAIQLKERRKRGDATVWRVVDILVVQPVLTANEVARQLRVTFPAANDAIAELVALEIVQIFFCKSGQKIQWECGIRLS